MQMLIYEILSLLMMLICEIMTYILWDNDIKEDVNSEVMTLMKMYFQYISTSVTISYMHLIL